MPALPSPLSEPGIRILKHGACASAADVSEQAALQAAMQLQQAEEEAEASVLEKAAAAKAQPAVTAGLTPVLLQTGSTKVALHGLGCLC